MGFRFQGLLLASLALAGGCTREKAARPVSDAAAPRQSPPPLASVPNAQTQLRPLERAPVIVTGVVARAGKALEICPGTQVFPCPGIEIAGHVSEEFVSNAKRAIVVRVPGIYDGKLLQVDGPIAATHLADSPDYTNPCPEFQDKLPPDKTYGENGSLTLSTESEKFAQAHADRLAGQWWDRERRTMVLWFTGDVTDLKPELRFSKDLRICLQGKARYSEHALEELRGRVDALLKANDVLWAFSSMDTVANRLSYDVEAIDRSILGRVAALAGEGATFVRFIELREGPLQTLPLSPKLGNVELVTERRRLGVHKAAIGRFSVHFDAKERCVYLYEPVRKQRLLPIWPFGYYATETPLTIMDFDGKVVAREGPVIKFGGGGSPIAGVKENLGLRTLCGAQGAFVGRPAD